MTEEKTGRTAMTLYASIEPAVRQCGADDCTGCQTDEQHNEPNPILVVMRSHIAIGAEPRGQYQVFLNTLTVGFPPELNIEATPEARDHARRVLTRLATTKEN